MGKPASLLFVIWAGALLLGACSQEQAGPPAPSAIRIDGSSTVLPLSQAVAEAYRAAHADAQIELAESGTTGGFEKFCSGAVDIADASRPITTSEMISCYRNSVRYVEIPLAFDGITLIVHPGNPVNSITLEELRLMWAPEAQGAVTSWRHVNARWPNAPLNLYGPGAASGTFDYFKEAVIGSGSASRTDYAASEHDDDIVNGVAGDLNALGYVGLAYYQRNQDKLKALAIDSGAGAVAPNGETIGAGAYRPLSRPMFIYVSVAALDRPEVAAFAEYYVNNAARLSNDVGYVALPDAVYPTYLERVQNRRYGTAFQGRAHAGETIEEVISRPLVEASS